MVNIHTCTTPMCPKCAYKILQIFSRVFEFALAEFCVKSVKINAPRIFPLLQYVKEISILPYFGKRKQVTKVTFLVKEQNVCVICTDVNGIS